MTNPPDPSTIDWATIAAWAGGISVVAGSVASSIWFGVRNAMKIAASLPAPPADVHRTNVYTTDNAALVRLANTVEALSALVTEANGLAREGNALRREATTERRSLREALDLNTEATERSMQTLGEMRVELRELTRELIRSQK